MVYYIVSMVYYLAYSHGLFLMNQNSILECYEASMILAKSANSRDFNVCVMLIWKQYVLYSSVFSCNTGFRNPLIRKL